MAVISGGNKCLTRAALNDAIGYNRVTDDYKLTTVAKHMGVSLENAHRAVHDTIATAEVMVKLLENF